ncbi:hypothetical protein FXO38_15813 [Capsicum annuum]|nr:hypothetical protein FXO38_15813 [Capsicum annuum]
MIRYRVILKKIAVEKNRVVEIAVDKFCILLVTPRKKGAHQEAGKRREREEVIKTGTGTGVEIETEIKKGTKIGIGIGIGTERGRRTVIVITEIVIGIGVIGERKRTRDRDEDDLHRIRDYDRISGFDMAPPSSPLLPGATDVTGLNATSYGSARKLQRLTGGIPYNTEIPQAIWNPLLTRAGSLLPKCAARIGVSDSAMPHGRRQSKNNIPESELIHAESLGFLPEVFMLKSHTLDLKVITYVSTNHEATRFRSYKGGIPYNSKIPWAIWNPLLTRRESPLPKCATRVGVSDSTTPYGHRQRKNNIPGSANRDFRLRVT